MEQEMEQLESLNPWDVVSRKEADERGIKVLPSTWAFKRKRYPNGSVRKLKARFCIRGDRQEEGIDYFETYAPVVSWSTVRLLLVLSVTLGLATKQVDYTLAFVQAGIKEEVYVEMPKLFEKSGCVYTSAENHPIHYSGWVILIKIFTRYAVLKFPKEMSKSAVKWVISQE